MSRNSLPQRQLLTVRQIVAALSILACLIFVVSYSSRILLGSKVQAELEDLQSRIEQEQVRHATIQTLLARVDDPTAVEEWARNQRNLAKPGEWVVVPVNVTETDQMSAESSGVVQVSDERPANWRLWLALIADSP